MDNFIKVLGDAAKAATCKALTDYGAAAPALTAIAIVEPTPAGEALAIGSGIAAMAASYGCNWDPNDQNYPVVPWTPGCQKANGNGGALRAQNKEFPQTFVLVWPRDDVVEILGTGSAPNGSSTVTFRSSSGQVVSDYNAVAWTNANTNYFIDVSISGETCAEPIPPPPPSNPDPYEYTDPDSGCQLTVNFQGWAQNPDGTVGGVWQIEPSATTRASGGIIGGCNFDPVIYYDDGGSGGDGGGPYSFPVPDPLPQPGGDDPWWADLLRAAVGGATAALVNQALSDFFATVYPGGSYELKGVCELDPDGNPMDVTRSINFPGATSPDAILYRLDALADMFQFAKDLKQPICKQVVEKPTGEPVTVTFQSDTPSPVSGNPVRKIFTYFDQSGKTREQHKLHWENFSWQAGPVIVSAAGTKLGKPQVWAASEAEGKRVINHAAQVAGVDMADVEWLVGSPKGTRNGLSGTMSVYVDTHLRTWVTKRDGPDGYPMH